MYYHQQPHEVTRVVTRSTPRDTAVCEAPDPLDLEILAEVVERGLRLDPVQAAHLVHVARLTRRLLESSPSDADSVHETLDALRALLRVDVR